MSRRSRQRRNRRWERRNPQTKRTKTAARQIRRKPVKTRVIEVTERGKKRYIAVPLIQRAARRTAHRATSTQALSRDTISPNPKRTPPPHTTPDAVRRRDRSIVGRSYSHMHPAKPDSRPLVRKCKDRPDNTKKTRGSGGASRDFIPWCR